MIKKKQFVKFAKGRIKAEEKQTIVEKPEDVQAEQTVVEKPKDIQAEQAIVEKPKDVQTKQKPSAKKKKEKEIPTETKTDENIDENKMIESDKNQILDYHYLYTQIETTDTNMAAEIRELVRIHNFIDLYLFAKLRKFFEVLNDRKKFEFFLESQLLLDHDDAVVLAENIQNINIQEPSLLYLQAKGLVNIFSNLHIGQQTEFSVNNEEVAKLRTINNKLLSIMLNGSFRFDDKVSQIIQEELKDTENG